MLSISNWVIIVLIIPMYQFSINVTRGVEDIIDDKNIGGQCNTKYTANLLKSKCKCTQHQSNNFYSVDASDKTAKCRPTSDIRCLMTNGIYLMKWETLFLPIQWITADCVSANISTIHVWNMYQKGDGLWNTLPQNADGFIRVTESSNSYAVIIQGITRKESFKGQLFKITFNCKKCLVFSINGTITYPFDLKDSFPQFYPTIPPVTTSSITRKPSTSITTTTIKSSTIKARNTTERSISSTTSSLVPSNKSTTTASREIKKSTNENDGTNVGIIAALGSISFIIVVLVIVIIIMCRKRRAVKDKSRCTNGLAQDGSIYLQSIDIQQSNVKYEDSNILATYSHIQTGIGNPAYHQKPTTEVNSTTYSVVTEFTDTYSHLEQPGKERTVNTNSPRKNNFSNEGVGVYSEISKQTRNDDVASDHYAALVKPDTENAYQGIANKNMNTSIFPQSENSFETANDDDDNPDTDNDYDNPETSTDYDNPQDEYAIINKQANPTQHDTYAALDSETRTSTKGDVINSSQSPQQELMYSSLYPNSKNAQRSLKNNYEKLDTRTKIPK